MFTFGHCQDGGLGFAEVVVVIKIILGGDLSNALKFLRDLFHEMYNLCFFWMAVWNMTKYIFHKNAIGNWKCIFLQKVKANIEIPSPARVAPAHFKIYCSY